MRVCYIGNKKIKHYRFKKKIYSFERDKWVNIEWADLFFELQRYPDVFRCEMGFNPDRFKELNALKRKIRFEGNLIKAEDPGTVKRLKQSSFVKYIAQLGKVTHVFKIINYVDPEYFEFVSEEARSDFGIVRRLGGWGDVQMILGAFPGFKKRYPNSKITFSCPTEWMPLAENNPHVDSLMNLNRFSKMAHFDAIVDVTDCCIKNEVKAQPNVMKNRIEIFAEAMSCKVENPVKEVYLTEAEMAEADKEDFGEGPLVGLVPKSNSPVRNWGRFRQLSEEIHAASPDATVLVMSSENMWQLRPWERFYIKHDLRKLLALINRCAVMTGPDTGPLHSAAQLGVPTVWVFTHIDGSVRTKNYEKVKVVQEKGSCPKCPCWYVIPCTRDPRKRVAGAACSNAIRLEKVRDAVIGQMESPALAYERKARQIMAAKRYAGLVTPNVRDKEMPHKYRTALEEADIIGAKSELAARGLDQRIHKIGIVRNISPNEVLDKFVESAGNKSAKLILFDKFGNRDAEDRYAYVCKGKFEAFLNECDVVVGPPLSLMHTAASLGVPTVWLTTDRDVAKPYYDAYALAEVNLKKATEAFNAIRSVVALSYVIVCHNCFDITKRCVDLVKKFRKASHEIIVVDNASTDWTKAWGPDEKDIKYIRLDKNHGCIIGRNRGLKEAEGRWLFILDNDQFISPRSLNALLNVQADIAGSEPWSMDRGGWAHELKESRGPLAYVGGGGLLIRNELMQKLGYLDERYAPAWFSDPDICFSARKKGYTIGYAKDHGIHHEPHRTVFSQKTFDHNAAWRKSFNLFKEKWADILRFGDFLERPKSQGIKVSKPKILLAADWKGWAWWYKSCQLQRYLSDEFDFSIKCLDQQSFNGNDKFDLYFTFGIRYISRFGNIPKDRKMTGMTAVRPMSEVAQYVKHAMAVHANSILLYNVLKSVHNRCYYVPNGVDTEIFRSDKMVREYPFTIAHVGKPVPKKGYETVIQPLMSKLKGVRLKQHRKHYGNAVPATEMAKFYQDIDVLVTSSTIDGTPNPALEAAATGKTLISNHIGNMPEFIEDGKNGFLVNLKVDEYTEKVAFLRDNRDKCREMGREALATVLKDWTWEKQTQNYRTMFREVLNM